MGNNLVQTVNSSLTGVWGGVYAFIPKLVLAIIVFIIGWIVGTILARVVAQIVKAIKLDNLLKSAGVESVLDRGGFKLDSGKFFGTLVHWFFVVVFLIVSFDIVQLQRVNAFLGDVVLGFIPDVAVAALILIAGAIIAHSVQMIVSGGARAASVPSSSFMGGVAKWAIWIFAFVAALQQLGIAGPFVQTVVTAFFAMLAIAGGLAFGLGGKDAAAHYLEGLRKDINGR